MFRLFLFSSVVATTLFACAGETGISAELPSYDSTGLPPTPAPTQEDRVVQVQIPKVDILFIVDNSCSMYEEQQNMANNFPVFMDYFLGSGLDYHIGVVSTDTTGSGAGVLIERSGVNFINDETPNAVSIFQSMVNLGTSGSADERGRRAAYQALEIKANAQNTGFLRDEAALHMVFVSDENDYSANNPTKQEFLQWMSTKKYSEDMVTAHTITSLDNQDMGDCAYEIGRDYKDYASATNGVQWSICTQDWSGFMDELGLRASGLKREYFLSEVPVPDSIEVRVETSVDVVQVFVLGEDVIYNGTRNSIIFQDFVPQPFDEVYVEYRVLAAEVDGGETVTDTGN